jgi:hypothetical protein
MCTRGSGLPCLFFRQGTGADQDRSWPSTIGSRIINFGGTISYTVFPPGTQDRGTHGPVRKRVCEAASERLTAHVSYCVVHTQSSGPTYLFPHRDRKAYNGCDFGAIVYSTIIDSRAGPWLVSLQEPNRKRGQISASTKGDGILRTDNQKVSCYAVHTLGSEPTDLPLDTPERERPTRIHHHSWAQIHFSQLRSLRDHALSSRRGFAFFAKSRDHPTDDEESRPPSPSRLEIIC